MVILCGFSACQRIRVRFKGACVNFVFLFFSQCFAYQEGKKECQRGCQYFNFEFLTNARNKDKVNDLNYLLEKCGECMYIYCLLLLLRTYVLVVERGIAGVNSATRKYNNCYLFFFYFFFRSLSRCLHNQPDKKGILLQWMQ